MLKVYDLFESGKLIYCIDMPHPEYLSLLVNQRPFRNDIEHVVPMIFRQKGPHQAITFRGLCIQSSEISKSMSSFSKSC